MATTTYENIGPIYLTQEKFDALVEANELEAGREYKIIDWEAQEKLVAGDNITIAADGKTISAAAPDLSEYAKTTEVNTAVATAVNNLVDGAPEALDTLKEIADNFSGVATQTWVEDKGYLTEHQDISGKLNILPNVEDESDPGYGYPYWIPYSFATTSTADGLDITLKTLTLDNTFRKMNFTNPFPVASATQAGIMTAADKEKLDSALQSHQDLSSYATQDWVNENYSTVALKPMKEEWTGTNLTTQQAADAILGDADTKVGDGFLGEVSWSDMYESIRLMNGEVKAFVVSEDIIQFEITSSTTEPYTWFYNSFAEEWRSYVPLVDNLTTDNVYMALTAKQGKVLNEAKQDKLTAGTGITIEDNVISASASGSSDSNYFLATYESTSFADIKAAYEAGKLLKLKYTPGDNSQATFYADLCQVAEFAYDTYGDQGTTFFFSCPKIYWSLSPALFEQQGTYYFAVYRGKSQSTDTWSVQTYIPTVPNASSSTVGGIKVYNDTDSNILYMTNDGTDPTPSE